MKREERPSLRGGEANRCGGVVTDGRTRERRDMTFMQADECRLPQVADGC